MTRRSLRTRLLAVPAVLSLALGGALLAAAPASAAPGTLTVTSPTEGATTDTRAVELTGAGTDGAGVSAVDSTGTVLDAAVVAGGTWALTLTFPADAPTAQAITVTQVVLSDPEPDVVTRNIVLPPADSGEPAGDIVIDTPADGATLDSRNVTFTGSAPVGSSVAVMLAGVDLAIDVEVLEDGSFEALVPLLFELGNTVTVTFSGLDADGAALEPVDVTVNLPAPIESPVILSPVAGAEIVGTTVTFRGTGIAGDSVLLIVLPADLTTIGDVDPLALAPYGVVSPDGTWTVSTTLPLGDYTAAAVHTTTPADAVDAELLSLPSEDVAFSLVAAPVGAPELAATGPTTTALTGPAALLVFAGLALLVVSRRRGAATTV